jgi:hypothetical protein
LGVISGMLEPYSVPMTGLINSISYSLWALWTLTLGVVVLRDKPQSHSIVGQPA